LSSKDNLLLFFYKGTNQFIMKIKNSVFFFSIIICSLFTKNTQAQSFSLEQVTSYPFIAELTSSIKGSRIALSINEKGKRNIFVGSGPDFSLHKVTSYNKDEGQEISGVTISTDGKWVVYVRGADHGAFDESIPRNPSSLPVGQKIEIYSVRFAGGKPVLLSEGDYPIINPDSRLITFIKNNQVWTVPIDGSKPAKILFYARGKTGSLEWSPDGSRMVFVSSRDDHSFIGIYTNNQTPIQWIAPSFARDESPHWSPDGKNLVFIRRPAPGGAPDSLTALHPQPWSILIANVKTGNVHQLWKAPATLRGAVPSSNGRYNLHWAAGNEIVFLSYQDGWPHMYSISTSGGEPVLLTPGSFNVEQIKLSPDKKFLVFATNSGPDKDDLDRRHIGRVSISEAKMEMLTTGKGIESTPVFINGGSQVIFLSATSRRPTLSAVMPFSPGKMRLIGEKLIPNDFPSSELITPKSVQFKADDGETVYGQLFEPKNGSLKKPAILFVHGGPQRQMLSGWHYMDYYANTYALNQYLASKGFIVLAVNYRLGVGYGYDFQHPKNSGKFGASEYQDIKAAGEWLAARPQVDNKRINIYGGSYGGFLTALALGRDSKLFSAGVDIHGMDNFMDDVPDRKGEQAPDIELAKKLVWKSSPVAYIDSWTSPVLIIHGDDDGNVPFHESVDLVTRFEKREIPFESLVIPDETHHWLKYSNMLKVDRAIADFLERKSGLKKDPVSLTGKIICLDPGHGGTAATDHYRQGPTGEREEWINLRVAQLLKKKLEATGAKVIMTRTTDTFVPLIERAKIAVANKAHVFISIHHNATADTSVNFPIIYFHGAGSENLAGVALGKEVAASLKKYFYQKKIPESLNSDYTIFPSGGAAVLRNTYGIPGVLAEASFFTNPGEENSLKQQEYNLKEAEAYFNAIKAFFKNPIPVIKPKLIPESLAPFLVFQEAERMNEIAHEWHNDFINGEKLMNSSDTNDLRKAYELFTRSVKSFPDSYLARKAHVNRVELLKKLNNPAEAKMEKIRVHEFYINLYQE